MKKPIRLGKGTRTNTSSRPIPTKSLPRKMIINLRRKFALKENCGLYGSAVLTGFEMLVFCIY